MTAGSFARSSLVMVGGSFGSRILGTVRAGLMTAIIGGYAAGEAFTLGNTLPNVFYMLAAGGILNAVLIPALARAMKLEDGGKEFTDRVITLALVGMLVITVLLTSLAGVFVWLLAGTRNPQFQSLALAFSLICLPQIFFYGLFALLGQILNAKGRFGAFAWAPFVANVVAVVGLILFIIIFPAPSSLGPEGPQSHPEQWTGPMIWLFAGSATVSVMAQALVLIPALRRTGFRWTPRWGIRGAGLGGVSRLALYAFAGLAISQVGFFVNQYVLNRASSHSTRQDPVQGTAIYNYAFTIFMLPHAFVTVSIITALFPRFAHSAAAGQMRTAVEDFRRGLILPLVANVPVMAFVLVAAEPIVALLYPGLDGRSIELGAVVLTVMMLGIVPFGIDLACYRMLYALERGRPTVFMQLALTAVTVIAGLVTLAIAPVWALPVVAFGQTFANVASSSFGLWFVRRELGSLGLSQVIDTAARIAVASAVAGLMAWGTITVMSPILGDPSDRKATTFQKMFSSGVVVSFTGILFVVVYLGLAHALRVREVRDLADMLRRRVNTF